MNEPKHAYLIIAHKDDVSFRTLIEMLDDNRNDIFIHMDLKCCDYHPKAIVSLVKNAGVYHIERRNVSWGGSTLIWVELDLLKKAIATYHYLYYHLLSGQDLPIKTQDYIHAFFDEHRGYEFVRFNTPDFRNPDRVRIFHLFQNRLGRKWSNPFNRFFLFVQNLIGIKRNRNISFYKGTQWFSITDGFARYVVKQEDWIKKVFRYTYCCDEVFLQTVLMRSPYKDNRHWKSMDNDLRAIRRLIDWERGGPYTFQIGDREEIVSSEMLFCRKIDESVDKEIIQYIKNYCCPIKTEN